MEITATDTPGATARVFITDGAHATEYGTAVEVSALGFVTVRLDQGGHIVVDPRDLRKA